MIKVRYVVGIVALVSALGLNLAAMVMHTNAQATSNRAGLVIQSAGGQVVTRCITFDEPEITGYELLRRSNLPLTVDIASGGTLCKIQNTGCNFPAQKCFCECQDMAQSCIYWQYYFQTSGVWKYSPLGMFGQKVTNGSINGWAYGAGGAASGGDMPPLLTIDQICGAAVPLPIASTVTVLATTQPSRAVTTPTAVAYLATATVVKPTEVATALSTTSVKTATPVPSVKPTQPALQAQATLSPTTVSSVAVLTEETAKATNTAEATATPLPTGDITTLAPASPTSTTSYIAFGVIAVVLVGLLLVTRAGQGKGKP